LSIDLPSGPIHVGKRCQVSIIGDTWNLATEPDIPCGFLNWTKHGGTQVHVSPDYDFRQNASGARDDTIPTTAGADQPVPEVAALIAIYSKSLIDRYEFIRQWCSEYPTGGATYAIKTGLTELKEGPEPYSKNWQSNVMRFAYRDPHFFREWFKEWFITMLEDDRLKELNAWQKAAKRSLESRQALEIPFEDHDDPDSQLAIHSRILRATKSVADEYAGVPYRAAVLKKLNLDGGGHLNDDQLRQRLRTLGLGWIPGLKAWQQDWAPVMKAYDW
jgi:hypothetical protein